MEIREYKTYREMRDAQQKRVNEFPVIWIFGTVSDEELKKRLSEIGAKSLKDCVSSFAGGLMHKDKVNAYAEMFTEINKETVLFLQTEDHLVDAIYCEMCNHEYGYTWEPEDTLAVFDETIRDTDMFRLAWEKAEKRIREE